MLNIHECVTKSFSRS